MDQDPRPLGTLSYSITKVHPQSVSQPNSLDRAMTSFSYTSSQDLDYNVNEEESWSTSQPEREDQEYSRF